MRDDTGEMDKRAKASEEVCRVAPRRRVMKGGLGAAPLLMTLVSRPVLGHGSLRCVPASGFHSMPTSRESQQFICRGRTPGFWKQDQHFRFWPSDIYPVSKKHHPATLFKAIFSDSPYSPAKTLLEVLGTGAGPPNDVARHIVAAFLNVKVGWAPVLTVYGLQQMWADYRTNGFFEPTAGVKWYHDEIAYYLKSTMPL